MELILKDFSTGYSKNKVINKINAGYTFIGFSLDFYFLGEKARTEMENLYNVIK